MRLTLRTLLAYLDNILDPADAELLGNKINESEFATSLVHQIQDSVRRLRLDAPALDAQGVGGDLNSVAEYLDNVLPPDQVPALEKACLDNDVNLGEVASCHQILTLVLGEAAPVTDKMRHRSYGIAPTALSSEVGSHIKAHVAHEPVPAPASTMIVGPPSSPAESLVKPGPPTETPATPTVTATHVAASIPVPDVSNKISEPPVSTDSRPGKRVASRLDEPSTKETWRAESSTLLSDQQAAAEPAYATAVPTATEVAAAATITQAATSAESVPRSAVAAYPDYMPRKSSWLRSVFITGIVALLILAGLLFATGSMQDNLLTRWLGTSESVASKPTTDPNAGDHAPKQSLTPVPATPRSSAQDEINIVSPNQQQPDTAASSAETSFTPPTFEEPPLSPGVPEQTTAFDTRSEELPELLDSNGFREPIEAPANVANVEPDPIEPRAELTRTAEPDPVPPFEASDANELAVEAPETSLDNTIVDRAVEADPLPDVIVTNIDETPAFDNSISVDPTPSISPNDFNNGLSETTTLEPVPVEPPVASAPDVGDLAISTRTNLELHRPAVPEPEAKSSMEPTKLKRDDQLLLLFEEQTKTWVRVDSKVQLQERDHLLGLPAFKSDIEIGTGLVCSLHGVGRLRLGPGSDVSILDGNIVLHSEEASRSQGIRFQGRRLDVQMIEAGTTVAIEASHEYIPGSDISEHGPHSILRIHPMDNSITVQLMGKTFDIPKGRHLIALDEFEPRIGKTSKMPKWMKSDSRKSTDNSARKAWKKQLDKIPDMHAWLQKVVERNYREDQRSLAARSLAEMDDFSAIVASLSDSKQHSYWDRHFDTLQRALTRGSEVQKLLKIELEEAYGSEQANLMMEMLRGYNAKQLDAGGAKALVKYLDHPNIEIRSLAIENLFRVTGARSNFEADNSQSSRNKGAKTWRSRLTAGRVKYSQAPELVKLLQTFTEDAE